MRKAKFKLQLKVSLFYQFIREKNFFQKYDNEERNTEKKLVLSSKIKEGGLLKEDETLVINFDKEVELSGDQKFEISQTGVGMWAGRRESYVSTFCDDFKSNTMYKFL